MDRVKIEKIPEEAFRETIANVLIHRTWDVNVQIRVLLFEDRIEVSFPGGSCHCNTAYNPSFSKTCLFPSHKYLLLMT